jgi:hypothetical protein
MKKKKQQKRNTRNSKILQATMVTLGALKEESPALEEMAINEIQVHLLDEDGDGVVLCLEYDEHGELSKTFSNVDEYYEEIEVELEGEEENENALFDEEYYGGRKNFTVEVLDDVSGEAESSFIEEAISEEYDEIFHSSDGKPPLLN